MFFANQPYRNRYGDQYTFVLLEENTYLFVMGGNALESCRFGAKPGQKDLDLQDLGMFDPSGGPFICIGTKIDTKPIVRISDDPKLGIVVITE